MVTIDCARCPRRDSGCEGCLVTLLWQGKAQVDEDADESCGYVLPPEVHAAIDVLRRAGVLREVDILAVEHAA